MTSTGPYIQALSKIETTMTWLSNYGADACAWLQARTQPQLYPARQIPLGEAVSQYARLIG